MTMVNIRWVSVIQKGICSGWPSSDSSWFGGLEPVVSKVLAPQFRVVPRPFRVYLHRLRIGCNDCEFTIGESVCAIRRITFDIYEIERAIASELPSLQHAR